MPSALLRVLSPVHAGATLALPSIPGHSPITAHAAGAAPALAARPAFLDDAAVRRPPSFRTSFDPHDYTAPLGHVEGADGISRPLRANMRRMDAPVKAPDGVDPQASSPPGLRGAGRLDPDPEREPGAGRALGCRDEEGAGRALGCREDGAGRALGWREEEGALRVLGWRELEGADRVLGRPLDGADRADGDGRPEDCGRAEAGASRRERLGRCSVPGRLGAAWDGRSGAAREGRLVEGTARDGADAAAGAVSARPLIAALGRERASRPEGRAPAAGRSCGVARGVTLGLAASRSWPDGRVDGRAS